MTNRIPGDPNNDLGTVNYAWLANNTLDWAVFVHSFVRCCATHPVHRVRHAAALKGTGTGSAGLQAADTLFDDLRFRYLSVVQKAQGTYHKPPYKDIAVHLPRMPANELAFDRAIYDIFFGGPRASARPQQIAQRLLPHCDRLSGLGLAPPLSMSWIESPETASRVARETASLLASVETVADAVEQVARRVRTYCAEHGIDPASLSMVADMSDRGDNGNQDGDQDSDVDYQWV